MKVCTAAQMHEIDRRASEIGGIPSIVLMENAAMACVNEIEKLAPKKVAVFCGKGNNGGDGLAIARQLACRGYSVEVFLVLGSEFSGDAYINYEILEKTDVKMTEITDTSLLEYYILMQDLIVDAIFGTGIHGRVEGIAAEVIDAINLHAKKTLSVDIPSGVNSDTGEVVTTAVKADITVTFAAYKRGLLLYPGADFAGKVITSDISIPQYIIDGLDIDINLIDEKMITGLFPARKADSHKGDYGKVFIMGGSVGMTGAAALAAKAALAGGAGLVTVGIPESLNPIMEVKTTEAMTLPLPEKNGAFAERAYPREKAENSDILLFGPGVGRSEQIQDLLSDILSHSTVPVIVDADGLYALSKNLDMLNSCGCNLIFTPHEMEFARLIGKSADEVRANRLELSSQFAAENGVTLVLKGHHTIVTAPDGTQYINTTGNAGMATGGSGDVLAGLIAAFGAYLPNETDAAILAVWLHGLAGDIAAAKSCMTSVTAGGICENIKNAISKITGGKSSDFMIQYK